jgi:hypothetical protein
MAYRVDCSDLDIVGCDAVFEGETPADVLDQARPYLKDHGVDLPNNELILQTGVNPLNEAYATALWRGGFDEDTVIVVRKLREQLDAPTER